VLLLGGPSRTGRSYNTASYRGLFRLLSEQHVPFAVSDNINWLGKRDYDLVIASDWAAPELATYIANGGRVLIVSARTPEIHTPSIVTTHHNVDSYFRVRNHDLFPSLKLTNLIMLAGDYTEVEGDGSASLSFVPPSMFGPPEKIHVGMKDTTKPGIVTWENRRVTWIPWDAAGLYYKHSLPGHAGLLRDVLDRILPNRQITTNAHPLVEMSLMRQGGRTLVHLINLSGHADTAYFAPVPMRDIQLQVAGNYKRAYAVRAGRALPITGSGFTLPQLLDYELIVLE
jgi:hypothetical protein